MRPEDILDAIGEVDEVYIRQAKQKRSAYKWILGTAAACFVLALLIPALQKGIWAENLSAKDTLEENCQSGIQGGDPSLESGSEKEDKLAQFDHPTDGTEKYRAEVREYDSEVVKCFDEKRSASLQAVLKGISARDSDGRYEEPETWGYSIQITDGEGNVTEYVLQDNALYNCTEYEYHILDTAELASLREAMGLD